MKNFRLVSLDTCEAGDALVLYGAIIGDIVGSRFEFNNYKGKDFEFFHPGDDFTDDTVMTFAIFEACQIIKTKHYVSPSEIERCFASSMRKWGHDYGGRGYGDRFFNWLVNPDRPAYNSWGNGSAMRVSAVGWLFDTLFEVQKMSAFSAAPTHNHPEGIKGARAVAGAVYLARTLKDKDAVKRYVESLGYVLSPCDEVRPDYRFDVSCKGTVPVAVQSFLESSGFEDAIRTAVSMGGDSDTISAITGSIAEAYFGVPEDLKRSSREYLDKTMLSFLDEANRVF